MSNNISFVFQINPDDGYKLSESTQAAIAGGTAAGKILI